MITINSVQIFYLFIFLTLIIVFSKDKVERYIQVVISTFIFIDFSVPPGSMGVKLFDVLTIVILPFFLGSKYKRLIKLEGKIKLVFLLFILTMFIGSYNSVVPEISLLRLLQQFNYLLFFIVITSYINYKNNFVKIKPFLISSILISLVFVIIQIIIGIDFTFYSQLNPNVTNEGSIRYPGPFQDPQKFAQFLAMAAFLFFAFSLNAKNIIKKYFICGILLVIAIFFSGSRGGLLGFAIGLFYFMIKRTFQSKKIIYLFVISLISIVTFVVSKNSNTLKRAENSDSDLAFRESIWLKAYNFFLESPVVGIGTGSYQAFVEKKDTEQFWTINDEIVYYNHPESGFVLWLVEYGIFGFAILTFVILYLINPFFKSKMIQKNDNFITLLEAAVISWVVGFVTVDSLGDKRIGIMLLILFSLLYLSKYNSSNKKIKFLRIL